jgi:dihydrofolate reductase
MRKTVAGLAVTLDGVVESPSKWLRMNDEMAEVIGAGLAQADAILLGRRTYLEFADLWPQSPDGLMAEFMNTTPKHVVSSSLDRVTWANSSLLTGELTLEVRRLKRQPGGNILLPGSPALVRSLLSAGLLDELGLMVHPFIAGAGMRLFDTIAPAMALDLMDSRTFSTGVVWLRYLVAAA